MKNLLTSRTLLSLLLTVPLIAAAQEAPHSPTGIGLNEYAQYVTFADNGFTLSNPYWPQTSAEGETNDFPIAYVEDCGWHTSLLSNIIGTFDIIFLDEGGGEREFRCRKRDGGPSASQLANGFCRSLGYSRAEESFQFAQLENVASDFLFASSTGRSSIGVQQFRSSLSQEHTGSRLMRLNTVTCSGRRR